MQLMDDFGIMIDEASSVFCQLNKSVQQSIPSVHLPSRELVLGLCFFPFLSKAMHGFGPKLGKLRTQYHKRLLLELPECHWFSYIGTGCVQNCTCVNGPPHWKTTATTSEIMICTAWQSCDHLNHICWSSRLSPQQEISADVCVGMNKWRGGRVKSD